MNQEITPFSIAEFTTEFFDSASKAWRMNKVRKGKAGSSKVKLGWRYKCKHIRSNGTVCKRKIYNYTGLCSYHYKERKYTGQEVTY